MIFKMDSPLMTYINTAVSFIALNVIFILCCIPIITIGPALTALYYVTQKEVRGEHRYMIRTFFKAFKENFVQGLLAFLLFAALLLFLSFSFVFWNQLGSTLATVASILIFIGIIVTLIAAMFVFPLIARFHNSFAQTIKNAWLMTITSGKVSLFLLLSHFMVFAVLYLFPNAKLFMLIIGFSFTAYCNAFLLKNYFSSFETAASVS